MLSPTILQKDGKTIVLGIVPDKLTSSSNYNLGWAHTLSLPREWSIDAQGDLVQKPYEGLTSLRSDTSVVIEPQTLNGELSLAPVSGREIEVEAVFTIAEKPFGIKILQNDNGACKIYYNPITSKFVVDCSAIGRLNNDAGVFDGAYTTTLPTPLSAGETMKIHFFLDHSVLDVFINDRWASSIRIFSTSSSATGVSLYADGDTPLQAASAWTMKHVPGDEPQGLNEIGQGNTAKCQKLMINGQLCIRKGDITYSLTGQEVR